MLKTDEKFEAKLTEIQKKKILENDNIAACALLEHTATGHRFYVYDDVILKNGKKAATKRIKQKLQEERILVFRDPDTNETEREKSYVYKLIEAIKGEEHFILKSQRDLSVREKVTIDKNEVIYETFGLTEEEIKKIIEKKEENKDILKKVTKKKKGK